MPEFQTAKTHKYKFELDGKGKPVQDPNLNPVVHRSLEAGHVNVLVGHINALDAGDDVVKSITWRYESTVPTYTVLYSPQLSQYSTVIHFPTQWIVNTVMNDLVYSYDYLVEHVNDGPKVPNFPIYTHLQDRHGVSGYDIFFHLTAEWARN